MKLLLALAFLITFNLAYADDSCAAKAADKKLAGAAKTSFMKKCEKDARAVCETDDISKKTNGAAKDAHIKKCVKDAVGT